MAIERALISVYDKSGLVEFAQSLARAGVEIVSTGGTAKLLREAGVTVRDVADLTGWPEMLGGRVKTLHPKVHGGILFRRGRAEDREQTRQHGIAPVDLVVVNLYPFEATAARPDLTVDELIENIDIGGPAMVRSASKNFESVAVVTDPADYPALAKELSERGDWSLATRLDLARKAFAATARYDGRIATELERLSITDGKVTLGERPSLPSRLHIALANHARRCAMGEKPRTRRQRSTFPRARKPGLAAGARQLQGKELSLQQPVDLDAAWRLAQDLRSPRLHLVKHNNPCGTAEHADFGRGVSAGAGLRSGFGVWRRAGVQQAARRRDGRGSGEALLPSAWLRAGIRQRGARGPGAGKNLVAADGDRRMSPVADAGWELKRISGGVLVQEPDTRSLSESELKVVTKRQPTREEIDSLLFAWKVAKHVKSNAIVFAVAGRTLGVGAGQMSRVDSVKIAVMKAQQPLAGSVVGSDAFFPFPDGVEEAARAGATAVIQPGGSVRDADVIAAADRLNLAMVFTGVRHFRH